MKDTSYEIEGYFQLTIMPKGAFATFYKKIGEEKRNSYPAFKELKEFSQKVANEINEDFPETAIVKNNFCYITDNYWEYCKNYVKANCKFKSDGYVKKKNAFQELANKFLH